MLQKINLLDEDFLIRDHSSVVHAQMSSHFSLLAHTDIKKNWILAIYRASDNFGRMSSYKGNEILRGCMLEELLKRFDEGDEKRNRRKGMFHHESIRRRK